MNLGAYRRSASKVMGLMVPRQSLSLHIPNQYMQGESVRFMGGGKKQWEHKLMARKIRKVNKARMMKLGIKIDKREDKRKDEKEEGVFRSASKRINPTNIEPVPEEFRPYLPAIEQFITNEWLTKYTQGAPVRRFQRDLAWRMKSGGPSPNKKLPSPIIQSIVGEFARKNVVEIWRNGLGSIKMIPPSPEQPTEQ
eukprot:CAMPEP_0202013580 /NCGR_PEP_ID=MMETSP0905-20130828/26646_1 /ASSEMBLY_ACC=CAM_ASM_000554 /TAXON_ID=420261 /ORGANISM="Thalassiosira antarctica, Strain CCMP982" /LENGTH=194 /DNA_ID=CAMNT_0048573197 /DNA_START=156 /DNA_END=740 /DNA_ORIENTATION=+